MLNSLMLRHALPLKQCRVKLTGAMNCILSSPEILPHFIHPKAMLVLQTLSTRPLGRRYLAERHRHRAIGQTFLLRCAAPGVAVNNF